MSNTTTREPLLTVGTITAAAGAAIGLIIAFGLDLSDDQRAAIMTAVSVLAPFIVAAVVRGKVTPVKDPRP